MEEVESRIGPIITCYEELNRERDSFREEVRGVLSKVVDDIIHGKLCYPSLKDIKDRRGCLLLELHSLGLEYSLETYEDD